MYKLNSAQKMYQGCYSENSVIDDRYMLGFAWEDVSGVKFCADSQRSLDETVN